MKSIGVIIAVVLFAACQHGNYHKYSSTRDTLVVVANYPGDNKGMDSAVVETRQDFVQKDNSMEGMYRIDTSIYMPAKKDTTYLDSLKKRFSLRYIYSPIPIDTSLNKFVLIVRLPHNPYPLLGLTQQKKDSTKQNKK